jgi:membrane-associated protein
VDFSFLYRFVEESVSFIKLHPELACLILFTWSFLETAFLLGLILPAEKVLFLSSVLASRGVISPFSFVLCVSLGTFLGYGFSYFLGYFLGEEALERLLKKFNVKEREFLKVKRFVDTKGELSLVFGRFIPVVRPVLPVVIGSFRPNYFVFSVFSGVGALLWASSYLFIGNLIDAFLSNIIKHKLLLLTFLLAIPVTYLFWRHYGKNQTDL